MRILILTTMLVGLAVTQNSRGQDISVLRRLPRVARVPAPATIPERTGEGDFPAGEIDEIPLDFAPWWQERITQPLRDAGRQAPVDVQTLVVDTLRYSQRVRAISEKSLIRETAIVEARAEFDVRAFMETKFVRTSDPTGSILEAGRPPRLREADFGYVAGVRKKTRLGGSVEVSERIGTRDSNSEFFDPIHQGNAKLVLSFTQPLLNGAGRAYNNSLTVLASIDTKIAWDRTSRELQEQLLEVTHAYWELYLQRAVLLQKQRHLQRAVSILEELQRREGLDALRSQIVRARSAVATRRSELIRATTAIRNAESRIRALVNAPALTENRGMELVTSEAPAREFVEVDVQDALVTALDNRPEVDEAMQQLQAATVRLNMSRNELLPVLNLVLESYVHGLRGEYQMRDAFVDQFRRGEPGYTAGLVFEVPIYNRAARARYQRRHLELRQLTHQFQAVVENLTSEVEVVVREVGTSFREMEGKYQAMAAADAEVDYLQQRWQRLPGEDRAASFLLEDLLDAQDRLAIEQLAFADSQRAYTVSLIELKRATGTLLQYEQIIPVRDYHHGFPQLRFDAAGTSLPAAPPAEQLPAGSSATLGAPLPIQP